MSHLPSHEGESQPADSGVRADRVEHDPDDLGVRALRFVTLGLGGVVIFLFLWVVAMRFRYPVDGEWMVGAVRDGIDRVRDGKQLYAPPAAEFAPFVYPPIYFWLSALLARFMSTFVAAKVVSLGATVAMGWGIVRISRALGSSRFWAGVGVALLGASYSLTLLFYDLERVDAIGAAFVVCGVAVLVSGTSLARTALGGAILGLAFFAKQPGALAFAAAVTGLLFAGERKRAVVAGAVGGALFAAMFAYLELTTHGWFRFYCVKLPGAHGMSPELLSTYFVLDMPHCFAYAVGSVAIIAPVVWSFVARRRAPESGWQNTTFAFVVAAGMVGAFSFRAHRGGWINVLVAWLPLACAACAIAATRAEEVARGTRAARVVAMVLLGGASLQILGGMFDPNDNSPNADDYKEYERFTELVRGLEKEGPVIITTTGGVGKPTSIHAASLFDIVRAGHPAPRDLITGLDDRKFAAIFPGAPAEFKCELDTCRELVTAIARNYFVAGCRHERPRTGMVGLDARPRWLMRPRKTPPPSPPLNFHRLMARQHIEMSLAEVERAKIPATTEVHPVAEIEERADRQLLEAVVDETAPDP